MSTTDPPRLTPVEDDALLRGLIAAALVCPVLGALLLAIELPSVGIPLAVLTYMAAISAVVLVARVRAERREALLWALAIATDRGVPLPDALRALSSQYSGRASQRLRRLAELLDAGAPLPDALLLVPGAFPRDAGVLATLAWGDASLAGALREFADQRASRESIRTALLARLAYVGYVALFFTFIASFVMYFVIPKFEAIFKDFGLPLPSVTVLTLEVAHFFLRFGAHVAAAGMLVMIVGLLVLPFASGDWPGPYAIGLDRLLYRDHMSLILRGLAQVVEAGRPLSAGLAALARSHPSRAIRARLLDVLHDVHDGIDCWDACARRGLIRLGDFALLTSASRVGNLPWALRELARSNERRFVDRLRIIVQSLLTVAVLAMGAVALILVASYFLPLIVLIESLAG